ncbi:MAG: hypothetical protein K6F99_03440 [Lachnospiraceae bacterium]|nr:hypothetical protein [Lachnospiraceae bacterium]
MDIDEILRRQFEIDTCVPSGEEFPVHIAQAGNFSSDARRYKGIAEEYKFIVYGDDAYICAGSESLDRIRELYGNRKPELMFKYPNIKELEKILEDDGYVIAEIQECFTPDIYIFMDEDGHIAPEFRYTEDDGEGYDFRELDGILFKKIKNEDRFPHALVEGDYEKPKKGMALLSPQGEVCGVAGAYKEGRVLWQIGVDVLPSFRNLGLGAELVQRLTVMLLKNGELPYYGTNIGNIISKRTALSAGYVPAWSELFIKKKSDR